MQQFNQNECEEISVEALRAFFEIARGTLWPNATCIEELGLGQLQMLLIALRHTFLRKQEKMQDILSLKKGLVDTQTLETEIALEGGLDVFSPVLFKDVTPVNNGTYWFSKN